jgi:uncharacterized protein (DUF1684 family)
MRVATLRAGIMVLTAVLAAGCNRAGPGDAAKTSAEADAAAASWRAKHEADYRRDWVSIAGLHGLKPGRNTAGSAAGNDIVLPSSVPASVGTFVMSDAAVRFEPAANVALLVSNANVKTAPVAGPIDLHDDSTRDADELSIGDVRLVIHKSGDHRGLRVRDPNGPLARGFAGFAWFPIDAAYRVVGRLIRDAQPQRLEVVNTYGDVDTYASEGVVEFTLNGQRLRLRPFTTRPKRFYFVFRDASGGVDTYKVARFLYADLRDDGTTVLDFNQAYNPPCAFNPYTTCPIPLRENRLPVKVLAGERAYAGPEPAIIAPPR